MNAQLTITDFYLKHKPAKAKVIFTDISQLSQTAGHRANGYIDPETGNIFIDRNLAENFPHLMDGAIMEELFHFKQFYRDNFIGATLEQIRRMAPNYVNQIEAEAAENLPKLGQGVLR